MIVGIEVKRGDFMEFYYENSCGDKGVFTEKCLVKAIYTAWNIEADLYLWVDNNWQIVFCPTEGNEFNCDLLENHGYEMIDGEIYREIIDIKTKEIIRYDWSEVKQLI